MAGRTQESVSGPPHTIINSHNYNVIKIDPGSVNHVYNFRFLVTN